MKYQEKQLVIAKVPFKEKPSAIGIENILDTIYDYKLIVYRVYGEHNQLWHYFICTEKEMDQYMEDAAMDKYGESSFENYLKSVVKGKRLEDF
jgi:hypothetical protein